MSGTLMMPHMHTKKIQTNIPCLRAEEGKGADALWKVYGGRRHVQVGAGGSERG